MVTLKDFVRETLVQIAEGVGEAKENLKATGFEFLHLFLQSAPGSPTLGLADAASRRSYVFHIDFDIAVTTEDTSSAEGGAGFNISIVRAGGDLASSSSTTNASRVKFTVPIVYPASK